MNRALSANAMILYSRVGIPAASALTSSSAIARSPSPSLACRTRYDVYTAATATASMP